MSEEDLELLITLDDPGDDQEEDTFNHHRADSQTKRLIMSGCSHLSEIKNVGPRTPSGCEECLKTGDQWVHLRLCETCGHVGCCNNSKNRHATKHFHSTNHPLIRSFEPGEDWRWCYVDELLFEPSVEATN
jgi:uncharacterized UBP type Zn finger protein